MFGFFPFLAGFTLAGDAPDTFILSIATLFTIICCEALLIHQINDYGEDLGSSDTTVTRIGIERGSVLLFSLFLLSVINLEAIVHYFDIETIPHGITLIYLVLYLNILFRGVINSVIGDHSNAE
jgi:1,4-dihydroxy-2-naphthoate octaprenyltransferase